MFDHFFTVIKNYLWIFKYIQLHFSRETSLESPIFIVGPPRSGTTLLYTTLISYDQFSGPNHETGIFLFRNPYTISMHPMPEKLFKVNIKKANSMAELLDSSINWFKQKNNSIYFVEKTPNHCLHCKAILKTWPNAKIIVLIRNPLDTIASYITNSSFIPQGKSLKASINYWLKCANKIRKIQQDRRVKIIRYEDLTCNTSTIKELILFLIPNCTEFKKTKKITHSFIGRKGFELLNESFTGERINRYKLIFNKKETDRIWKKVENSACHFGYKL